MTTTTLLMLVLAFGVAGGVTFMGAYARYARGQWHRYSIGWHLMTGTGALTFALAALLVSVMFGPFPRGAWCLILFPVGAILWHRVIILLRIARQEQTDVLNEPAAPAGTPDPEA